MSTPRPDNGTDYTLADLMLAIAVAAFGYGVAWLFLAGS